MTLTKRLGSMLLDHFIMCIAIAAIGIPLQIINFLFQRFLNFEFTWLIGVLIALIYFNKDFFRAKSPAKRLLGLKVIDNKTGDSASRIKCFIRNLTCVIWPIEVLFSMFSTHRRLGDLIANTRVVDAEKEPLEGLVKEIKVLRNKP